MTERVDKAAMACNKPKRTPGHPEKSHIVKACYDGKEKIIRFGEQGKKVGTVSGTAGKPKAGESDRMKAKRKSFKARHAKNIAKGPSSAAYWANKVKWADGGHVELSKMLADYEGADDLHHLVQKFKTGGQAKKDAEPGLMDYLKSVANTVTSLPEAPAAIYNAGKEFVQAIPRVARTAAGYINNTPITKVGQDVRGGLNAVARQARQNPVGAAKTVASAALDVIPVIGDIKAYGQDVSNAARMRARGDVRGAQNIERMALPLAIASIAPGVGEARLAGKAARAAEEAVDVADDIKQLTRRLTSEPKSGSIVKPMRPLVREGYISDKSEREANLSAFRPYREDSEDAKVFYHATPNEFSVFKPGGDDPEMSGNAIWLSPYAEYQPAAHNVNVRGGGFREGANVMPLYARMEKPLVLDDPDMISWAREVFAGGRNSFPQMLPQEWVDNVRSEGYDSIIYKPKPLKHVNGTEIPSDEYIVFEPTQLKSAIGNRGTYDPNDPDIGKARGGIIDKSSGYADGGLVSTYDEAKVNDLADQIREGIYG